MGGLPATVVADVFHCPRARTALLHRAFLRPWLQQLYARRRDPAGAARDLERPRLSGFPVQPAVRRTAGALPELWDAMEPVTLVIPTFNEAETIDAAIREIPAAYLREIRGHAPSISTSSGKLATTRSCCG